LIILTKSNYAGFILRFFYYYFMLQIINNNIFFLQYWGLNSGPIPSATPPANGFYEIGSCRTICLGWFQTMILLISASWVARITGVSYQCPATIFKGQHWT
jgi:hypothetical protein